MEHLNFSLFAEPVAKHIDKMVKAGAVFVRADIDPDVLYEEYQNAYPPEMNTVFRVRREYDGSYDKSFIRRWGNVLMLLPNGAIHSIWDVTVTGYFQQVADRMSEYVHNARIKEYFALSEQASGSKPNVDNHDSTITWTHFYLPTPSSAYMSKASIGSALGTLNTNVETLRTAFTKITADAVETVKELVAAGSLYRGTEFISAVTAFGKAQKIHSGKNTEKDADAFLFLFAKENPSLTHIRNTAIGTLLRDLSEGVDLESAVRSYESVTAPANYKRPTSLVTPKMIEAAKAAIEELGYTDSLMRVFATPADIPTDLLLFKRNRSTALNVFDDLTAESKRAVSGNELKKTTKIGISDFVSRVLPTAEEVEIYVNNSAMANRVALLTEQYPGTKNMFKWDNPLSWAYAGNVTDAIKERVKTHGGSVTGVLRASLAWHNGDDLDLSVTTPSGLRVYFGERHVAGGMLDIDMNAGRPTNSVDPVENIVFAHKQVLRKGDYHIIVDQFSRRSNDNPGFDLQVEIDGVIHNFCYKGVFNQRRTTMVTVHYDGAGNLSIKHVNPDLVQGATSGAEVWGIKGGEFVPVTHVMRSPNVSDKVIGNGHTFFILEGCASDEPLRGFFNEYLKDELVEHRKVFELLGSRTMATPSNDQVAGVGFSDTLRNEVTVRVKSKNTKLVFDVQF